MEVDAIDATATSPPMELSTMTIVMIEGPAAAGAAIANEVVQASLAERARTAGQALLHYRCASEQQLLERLSSIDRGQADIILFDPGHRDASAPLRDTLENLAVPYIEVRDDGHGRPDAAFPDGAGPRVALIQGYAAQGYTLAMSLALEQLGCADSENDFNVGT